ncbi:MAG: radical SAM protein [Endomicrobiaceae bacterium]|nr:radical SAM protein [Endomicrobiaceae bacterium]
MNYKQIFNLISSLLFQNKPVYAHYAVTHRCNLQCTICDNNCICPKDRELTLAEIEGLADFLKQKGIGFISLSGGDPFIRTDITDIVKIFSKKGIKTQILSNTLNITDIQIKQLLKIRHFYGFSLSLHSLSEETSLKFYNDKDLFKEIIGNINRISKLVKKNKILLNTVISPLNINEIYDIAKFAKSNNLKISFLPIEHNNNESFKFKKTDFYKIDQLYDFLIIENKKNNYIFNSSQFLEMSRQYQKGLCSSQYCHAGKLYISINPDGNIASCHKYHTHSRKNFNDTLIACEKCSDCMRPCWIEISNFFTNKKSFFERIKKQLINYFNTIF